MRRELVLLTALIIVLAGTLGLAFEVQRVEASGTIYIRADGSIDGPANITTVDSVIYYFNESNYDEIVVERDNIIIDGAGYTLQGTGAYPAKGINLTGRVNVTIRNMEIKVFYYGIYFYNSSISTISGNNITNNYGDGIWLSESSNNNIISGNNITNNQVGFRLETSSNNTVSGNKIAANSEEGIYLYLSSINTISGNNIKNNTYGIYVGGGSNNTISENKITANSLNGIWLGGSHNNTVSGNKIAANSEEGIYLTGSRNNIIPGNNITENSGVGMYLYYHCDNNTVSGNSITENSATGILLWRYCNYNTFSGNNITENLNSGIFIRDSSNNNVSENNVTNNRDGIWLYEYSDFNTVSGNNITENLSYGIRIHLYCDNNTVSGNNITNSTYAGVTLYLDCSNNTVSGNNITNNEEGIFLLSSRNNSIRGNTVTTNNNNGIMLDGSNYNTFSGNNITNNEEGIWLAYYCSNNTFSGNNITNNYGDGIFLSESSDNTFHHNNFINNTQQVTSFGSINVWDDGYPSGGNYWSDYPGVDVKSGPNQDQPSSDGIGDTAYVIDGNNRDNYPLMYPWNAPAPPSYNLTIYSSPTGVTFTVDGVSRTTPWSGTYSENASVGLVMPETHDGYIWSHWLEDGDPNRIKTVTVDTNITLTASFTPDTTPPTISILSPENKTYSIEDVPLNFTLSESTSWIGYSLDSQANVTIFGNTTLPDLSEGTHTIIVYANDTAGNMGASDITYFTVDTTSPNITDVSQDPHKDNVLPEDEVKINATVTDYLSEVTQVTLNFTNGNGTWITIDMTPLETNVWNATIPPFEYCTYVNYTIMAQDSVGNTVTTEELGYELQYHVIPESPSFLILPLFMIATLLAVIVYRRKYSM